MPLAKALAASVLSLALALAGDPAAAGEASTPARRLQAALGLQPEATWVLRQETSTELRWLTPQKLIVSVKAMPMDRSIVESLSRLATMQDYFRKQAGDVHGGLVEAAILQGRPRYYGLVTLKVPAEDAASRDGRSTTRFVYDVDAIFPFAGAIGLLDVVCMELSDSETRVAMIPRDPARPPGSMRPHDPYDRRFDAGALFIDADARDWDGSMPDHPLSRARALMTHLLEGAPLADGVRRDQGSSRP